MGLTRAERETIVRWSMDEDEGLTVYTHNEIKAKRLLKLGGKLKRESKHANRVVAWEISCPRDWFKWPGPKRKVSEARRAALRDRFQNARPARGAQAVTGGNGGNSDPT